MTEEDFGENLWTAIEKDNHTLVRKYVDKGTWEGKPAFHGLTYHQLSNLYRKVLDRSENKNQLFDNRLPRSYDADKKEGSNVKLLKAVGRFIDKLLYEFDLRLYRHIKDDQLDDYPAKSLFLLSVIFNRKEMALICMRETGSPVASALVGSALLRGLAHAANRETEFHLERESRRLAKEFEDLSVSSIHQCYLEDNKKTGSMVIRKLPEWSGATLLSIADSVRAMDFMYTEACQSRLSEIWDGYFMVTRTSPWTLFFGVFFPLLILKERISRAVLDENSPTHKNVFGRNYDEGGCGPLAPLTYFYSTPRVKLFTHSLSYLMYLLLFSYFMTTNLAAMESQPISVIEYIVWVWVATLFLDEIRQMLGRRPQYPKSNWYLYTHSGWNWLDMGTYLMMGLSVVLRLTLTQADFLYARTAYALTLYMSFHKVLHVFHASRHVGPLVIAIRDMIQDLLIFLLVVVVFIIAYAVPVHGLIFPNVVPSWQLIINIIYQPYWNIFGELFEEGSSVMAYPDEGCTHNETLHRMSPEDNPRCPADSRLSTILFGVYLIVTNILLMNLLIAIFTNTFERVRSNSEKVHNFYRHQLVQQYSEMPTLAPPLILLDHTYRCLSILVKKCLRKTCGVCERDENTPFYRNFEAYSDGKQKNDIFTYFEKRVLGEKIEEIKSKSSIEELLKAKMHGLEQKLENYDDAMRKDVNHKLDQIAQELKQINANMDPGRFTSQMTFTSEEDTTLASKI